MARWERRRWIDRGPQPTFAEPRPILLAHGLSFVRAASACHGVRRIALVGSMTTSKPIPKDIDMLVTVSTDVDLPTLALGGDGSRVAAVKSILVPTYSFAARLTAIWDAPAPTGSATLVRVARHIAAVSHRTCAMICIR